MTTRRDFLAIALSAIAAGVTLPVRTDGEPRTNEEALQQLDAMAAWDPATARLLEWWDQASPHERLCGTLMLKRVSVGMPVTEAGEMFRLDLVDPSRPVTI
jgi:hypothetical protein